ncbi:serine protease [Paraburkholderia phenazinium]|uniref:Serine protease n=1 Tax=Paraburkholderia phenazinium TaxID=60549 RepID=A0A1G7R8V3_9BURK|nr:S8 family serine peptidase [Paraburkholderia phenazinium]SDG07177.1 serine protease [Paraburkholderia phenazinium]
MKTERHNDKPAGFCKTICEVSLRWSNNASAPRAIAGGVSIVFSLALAACGGDSGVDPAAGATPTAQSMTEVAAAASAASSNNVPLATSLKMKTSSITSDTETDRFIVKYKTGTAERGATAAVQSRLDKLKSTFPARAHHLRRMGIGSDVVTTERKLNAKDSKAFMRALASDPDVEYVEPDTVTSIGSSPNDPLYGKQWALTSNQMPGVTTAGIRAEGAWDLASGAGIVIGVVDNGVTSHSDLSPNVLPGYDFSSGPYGNLGGDGVQPANKAGETCAITWHGTHVAGIMAAVSNNGIGIAGIAPAARIVSARTVTNCAGGWLSDMADGIRWAAGGTVPNAPVNPNPAKVINVSLQANGQCQASLQDAIDDASSRGAIVVAISGNYDADAARVQPASCRNVITVGATNSDGSRWVNSDYGPTVDIAAPGSGIWSTYNDGKTAPGNESYGVLDGTSQAAPMVSGVAALVQSVAPKPLTVAEMRTLIQQSAQPFAPKKPDRPFALGIVDATAAVTAAKSGKIPAAADFSCSESPKLMQITCINLSTARGGTAIKSWAWNFGDGAADYVATTPINMVRNFDYGGTYNIKLTVTDSAGATSTYSRPFQVLPPAINYFLVDTPTSLFAKTDDMQYYELDIPNGVKGVTITLKPTTTNERGWLYLRAGTPSVLHPQCQAQLFNGNTATCTMANPAAGAYYVIVSAQAKLNGSILTATYTQ